LKKTKWLLVLAVCVFGALYLYIDTNTPTIEWGVEANESINHALNVNITDDIGLKEVCYSMSGGACSGEVNCSGGIQSESFNLLIEPDQCIVNSDPLEIEVAVNAIDSSPVANKTSSSIKLTYDKYAPTVMTLKGSRSLKQGGAGVVLYEVGEVPRETGIILGDLLFKAFEFDQNRYLGFYAHPYNVEADDFRPRIFAVDAAGNTRKIRPGSRTASHDYRSEVIALTDDFLASVKDKMMASSPREPLEVFVEINNKVRQENYEKISQLCRTTEPRKLWQGVFLRNQGATKAGFADDRAYKYRSEVVSQQVHLGIDIAGVNHTEILAANHGKVIFVGEIGIYGNVVILDHGYGLHTLYGHLYRADVREGDSVRKGDVIAVSGDSGLVFGDHLHFEVRVNGIPVNPIEWFDDVWVKNNIESFLPGADEKKDEA
jgi:murein DD-endopeptidase MepM/ murein hydrolase activator NlpD